MKYLLKISAYFFSLCVFTLSFFFIKISSSSIDITLVEALFKPYLINNIKQYDLSFHKIELIIDDSEHKFVTNIGIDFFNKGDQSEHHFSSKINISINSLLKFKFKYQFDIFLRDSGNSGGDANKYNYNIKAEGSLDSGMLFIKGSGSKLPVSLVKGLWPESFGKGARGWTDKNLSKGTLSDLVFNVKIPLHAYKIKNKILKNDLSLNFNFQDMEISFLEEMSLIYDANGSASLNGESFKVNLSTGSIRGSDHNQLDLSNSTFIAHQFQKRHGPGELNIQAQGNLKDFLLFLFQHPRDLKRFFPLKLDSISAFSETTANIIFPLKSKITFNDVTFFSKSKLKDASLKNLYFRDLNSNNISVNVSNKEIEVLGEIVADNQNLKFKWHQAFNKKKNSTNVSVKGPLEGKAVKTLLEGSGLNFDGIVDLDAKFYGDLSGMKSGSVTFDGREVKIDSHKLLWSKPKFSPLLINAEVSFLGNNEILFSKVLAEGPLISFSGNLRFANKKILNIYFPIFKLYSSKRNISTDLSLNYVRDKFDNVKFFILGDRLVLGKTTVLSLFNSNESDYGINNFFFRLYFNELVSVSGVNYNDVEFLFKKDSDFFDDFLINASLGNKKIISGSMLSNENLREINFFSQDTKILIDILGLNINIIGGPIGINGFLSHKDDKESFNGKLVLGEFSIIKLPIFAKLLNISIPSLTSFLDNDSGINFKSAISDISVDAAGIRITDGVVRADSNNPIFGSSLGMTLSGIYGFSEKTNISGTLVPLAGVNKAPSKLPLLGGLFKGDKKGQGLIGINFKMYENDDGEIEIQTNPLSILAPGFLQGIF